MGSAGGAHGGTDMRQLLTLTTLVPVSARHIWGADDMPESDDAPAQILSWRSSTRQSSMTAVGMKFRFHGNMA